MSKKYTLEKRRPERQEERRVSRCWNKSCLIHSKNFNTNTPNISTEWNPIWQNERKSMKLDSVIGVLNSFNEVWCDNKKAELPVRHSTRRNINSIFFMIRCYKMWYARLKLDFWRRFRFLPYFSYVTWLYHVWH